jgi:outer membrane protein assembly factor BamB
MAVDTPPPKEPRRVQAGRHFESHSDNGIGGRKAPASPRLLDPHGIYGTRSANRLLMARRRRMLQNLIGLAVLALIVAGWWAWQRVPRAPALSLLWSRSLSTMPSAPAAVALAGTQPSLLVPTDSGRLIIVDVRNGQTRNIALSAFPLRAQPLVVGNAAFLPCEDGILYAVDWQSGRTLWRHDSGVSMTTRPAVFRMALPQQSTLPPNATPASQDNATPNATASPSTLVSSATPTPRAPQMQSVVVAANDEGVVIALRISDGKVLWRRDLKAPVGNGLTIWQSEPGQTPRLYVPVLGGVMTRGGLRCLDAVSGRELWKYPSDPTIYAAQVAPPVIDEQNGVVYCVDDTGTVSCLEARSGKRIWKRFLKTLPSAPPDALPVLRAEPVLLSLDGQPHLFVAGNDGGVRCIQSTLQPNANPAADKVSQSPKWSFDAGGAVRQAFAAVNPAGGSPQAANSQGATSGAAGAASVVAVGSDKSSVLLLDARTGRRVAQIPVSAPANMGVLVFGDQIICISDGALIESFDLRDLRHLALS